MNDEFELEAAFKESFDEIAPGVNEAATQASVPGESYIDTLARIMTSLALTAQQVQLMRLNIERARAGQPPIDVSAYSGAGVNVGLTQSTQRFLMFAGLGLLAVLAMRSAR